MTTDTEKVAAHDQRYDFFVFVTTADPQSAFRRRLESDLQDTHGWKVDI